LPPTGPVGDLHPQSIIHVQHTHPRYARAPSVPPAGNTTGEEEANTWGTQLQNHPRIARSSPKTPTIKPSR
jgi:hypothetical protein